MKKYMMCTSVMIFKMKTQLLHAEKRVKNKDQIKVKKTSKNKSYIFKSLFFLQIYFIQNFKSE